MKINTIKTILLCSVIFGFYLSYGMNGTQPDQSSKSNTPSPTASPVVTPRTLKEVLLERVVRSYITDTTSPVGTPRTSQSPSNPALSSESVSPTSSPLGSPRTRSADRLQEISSSQNSSSSQPQLSENLATPIVAPIPTYERDTIKSPSPNGERDRRSSSPTPKSSSPIPRTPRSTASPVSSAQASSTKKTDAELGYSLLLQNFNKDYAFKRRFTDYEGKQYLYDKARLLVLLEICKEKDLALQAKLFAGFLGKEVDPVIKADLLALYKDCFVRVKGEEPTCNTNTFLV